MAGGKRNDQELSANKLASVVGDITALYRAARDELGPGHEVTWLLDDASGLVDEAWDIVHEMEEV